MNHRISNILTGFSRALVLVPYTLFFAVQVFFNYDIAQPATGEVQQGIEHRISTEHKKTSPVLADKSNDKKTHFRLNKRFQPAGPLSFDQPSLVPLISYILKEKIGDYVDPLTASFYLSVSTLRGPPAAV